ncbi:DNA-directed RNA polymerase sigma-70 factor [Gemmatimonadetes bacterium T265]|nr:DNA-directed RNA polymerase sigma-70 factor [Gemmatimonadetes bacterium T265]
MDRATDRTRPPSPPAPSVTARLAWAAGGDREAFDGAIGLLYGQLATRARAQLRREGVGHTLDTGALVHEAHLRLDDGRGSGWADRGHFLAVAATAMRRVLVDHARRAHAAKRGGDARPVTLSALDARPAAADGDALVALDEAMEHLAAFDARQARVVECRYFAGLTEEVTAAALGVGLRTVKRDLAKARAWLRRALDGDAAGGAAPAGPA